MRDVDRSSPGSQPIFLPSHNRWEPDEQVYSLSALGLEICMKFSEEPYVGSGSFPGLDFWAIEEDTVPLNPREKQVEADAGSMQGFY